MTERCSASDEFPWAALAEEAAGRWGTPSYLFSWGLVLEALEELRAISGPLPVRHWLSLKTLPLRHLLAAWRDLGLGVEVVSEFELRAALREGFEPRRILVNGVAKQAWLPHIAVPGLRVHFDSLTELEALSGQAAELGWWVGLRFHPQNQRDSEEPDFHDQFGLTVEELRQGADSIRAGSSEVEGLHFHLRSNVSRVEEYLTALDELGAVSKELALAPAYVDCGGGFPVAGEVRRDGVERAGEFELGEVGQIVERVADNFPTATEVWFENGRFLTARAGVLALKVLDVKERGGLRYLICDGGRVNQAIVSDWEVHRVQTAPERSGPEVLTTVCGPTCMSFDRLGRFELPADLGVDDLVLWMSAGAYHSTWESRFSFGLSALVWIDEQRRLELARPREGFDQWWPS